MPHSEPRWMLLIRGVPIDISLRLAPEIGQYLMPFNVAKHDGRTAIPVTRMPEMAATFGSVEEAISWWRTQSTVVPLRPDGEPNRPLTAFSISVIETSVVNL